MSQQFSEISKFLSFVLRHKPESIGITLDVEGWTNVCGLIVAANKNGMALSQKVVEEVVALSDKKRFAISENRLQIRALQGHSAASVSIAHVALMPPEFLYHGTATRLLKPIEEAGLIPGARQYVHLAADIGTAADVGKRYGKPFVLKIKALQMHSQGFQFFQAENGVWLTASVPSGFIVFNDRVA